MGQVQHTNESGAPARGRRLGRRTCLRKGCGRRFQARRPNQRYCREPECLKEVRRWQAAKRQQKRRASAEGRRQHAETERQRRQRKASAAETPQEEQPAAPRPASGCPGCPVAAEPARGHAAERHPEIFCDRPGCYDPVRKSPCAPASYCGDACRRAVNRVHDRERQVLAAQASRGPRQTPTGVSGGPRQTSWRRRSLSRFRNRTVFGPAPAVAARGRTF